MRRIMIGIFVLVFMCTVAMAETPQVKAVGPILGSTGTVFTPGKIGIVFKYMTFDMEDMYDGNTKKDYDKDEIMGAYKKSVTRYQGVFRYGIFPRFDIRLVSTFVSKELDRHMKKMTPAGPKHVYKSDDNMGLGDTSLISRYQVLSQKAGDPVFFALGAGIKMPTGSTDEKADGTKLPVFLQNGSGSWDPMFEVGLSKAMGRLRLDSHMVYVLNTEGAQDTKKGDMIKYNLSASYAVHKFIDLQLELFGRYMDKVEVDGSKLSNTGGHVQYIVPGVKVKFGKRGHFGVAVPYVINRNLNGEQLVDDYRVVGKVALFF